MGSPRPMAWSHCSRSQVRSWVPWSNSSGLLANGPRLTAVLLALLGGIDLDTADR